MENNELVIQFIPSNRLSEIFPIAQQFWSEGNLLGSFNQEVFTETWTNLMNSNLGRILGAYRGSKLVGTLGFVINTDPNDAALVSQEMFWFVDPNYRKGEGLKLLKYYEEIAKSIGVKRIGMVHLQSDNNDTLAKLFTKRGYRAIETHYMKEIT